MKRLRMKYPIWISLILTVLFPAVSLLGAMPMLLWDGVWGYGEYLPLLIAEVLVLLVLLLVMKLLGMSYVLRSGVRNPGNRLLPVLPILLLYTYSMAASVIFYAGEPMQPPLGIFWFVLCMLAVGITEELAFRGLMTRMIFEKYGRSAVGVWLSVLLSSLLFGAVHITNAAEGGDILGGVLVQAVNAVALGMCLGAIYLRTNSLWTVALLHAYMDFCALISTGVFTDGSVMDTVGAYSPLHLLASVFYALLALFLLRPSKLKRLIPTGAETLTGDVIKLMLTVMLASGLFSAVAVLLV